MNTSAITGRDAAAGPEPAVFRLALAGVAYDDVPPVRAQLLEFLAGCGADRAYAGRLALTVTEILTNLVKHPPGKARRVEITLRLSSAHAAIDVADDSTPFADFDAKCKEALSRLNAAQSLAESGYGLGVIIRQHGHPAYTPIGRGRDGLNHFCVRDGRAPREDPRKKAFLVDDDPVALRRHRAILENLYAVVPFDSAEKAAGAFPDERPDIVVSDLNMPRMDGIALRRALSEMEGGDATPFIFLSAQASSENSPYISALGVDDFLCKPVTAEKLRAVVARLIARARQVRLSLEGKFQQHLTAMLRPSLPESCAGWRIVTLSEMVEAGGGDFTLWHETPAHFLAVLADVMGHGPQAKFFSYAYAGYLRSLFRMQAAAGDPAAFLKALSDSVAGDAFLESVILTCQSFQLFSDGGAAIATAGHPAPFLVRLDGAAALDIAGPLPALGSDAGYNLLRLRLLPGEKLVFATDGFLQGFGAELAREMGRMAAAQAQDFAKALWKAHESQPQGRNRDDATLIVAQYGGTE